MWWIVLFLALGSAGVLWASLLRMVLFDHALAMGLALIIDLVLVVVATCALVAGS